jgi:eukaryotic-like serine/threonine-protein kinase
MQVARGLDYAHYRGIIHRDIKPANIMIAKNGGVKLMDFGIARDQAFGDLTETGTGLGTPSYMSPEQILGDKLDFRSDMFSLGIVLYQMVCGRKPFIEDEHKSVMHKIRLEKYIPPRRLNPNIPRELERILARCMEKRKENRFRSSQDLVLALERFISKRVEMNYHARLVLFLRDQKVITPEEADAQLHPAIAGGYKTPSLPGPLGWAGWRRLASVQAAILGTVAVLLAFVHASQIGAPRAIAQPAAPAPPPPKPPGFLKVVVEPWADVYIDGRYAETTPFAKALSIPEGEHSIQLKNPFFVEEARKVNVKRGATATLKVALARK